MFKKVILIGLILNCSVLADAPKLALAGNTPAKLNIKVPARCMSGDFDLILKDLAYQDKNKIILEFSGAKKYSLPIFESLFEVDKTAHGLEMTKQFKKFNTALNQIYKSGESVTLPKVEDGVYALKVCNDYSDTKTCEGKKVADVNTRLKEYTAPKSGYQPEEAVYYETLVEVKNGKFSALDSVIDSKNSSELSALNFGLVEINSLAVLQSLPLKIAKGSVILELPRVDTKNCGMK